MDERRGVPSEHPEGEITQEYVYKHLNTYATAVIRATNTYDLMPRLQRLAASDPEKFKQAVSAFNQDAGEAAVQLKATLEKAEGIDNSPLPLEKNDYGYESMKETEANTAKIRAAFARFKTEVSGLGVYYSGASVERHIEAIENLLEE
jgi:hypothetical protein